VKYDTQSQHHCSYQSIWRQYFNKGKLSNLEMKTNNVITTGRSGSNTAVVRLIQCGLGQFRRIVVLLGHKVAGIWLTAIN
jgi:hypothetical protein